MEDGVEDLFEEDRKERQGGYDTSLSKRNYCFLKRFERSTRKELNRTKGSNINDE